MIGQTPGAVFYGSGDDINVDSKKQNSFSSLSNEECRKLFTKFIREFNQAGSYVYRDQLISNANIGEYYISLELHHLNMDDITASDIGGASVDNVSSVEDYRSSYAALFRAFRTSPLKYLPICELALKEIYLDITGQAAEASSSGGTAAVTALMDSIPDIQLQITSQNEAKKIRELKSETMENLVIIPGIVIQASKPQHKAKRLKIMCKQCRATKSLHVPLWRQGVVFPRVCDTQHDTEVAKCPLDPYIVLGDESEYIDIQSLKLQELPEHVPTSDMPRHISLHASRYLTDRVVPGLRVMAVGVFSAFDKDQSRFGSDGVRPSYIYLLGICPYDEKSMNNYASLGNRISYDRQDEFRRLAALPDIHEKLFKSIAPAIYGSDEIKQAIACMLFGGSHKKLPDGTRVRGDINILLLGDPSTAKSQFLKFTEKASPISVYTSGKGSSAAGLTAAIVRDAQGHFALEGGAMVLADGGIVCIDEFDKMRDDDRVAIHEAMEQQTISIAKAGITTVLNTKCAVLAAANPSFGSYDDSKDTTEQHDFETTILSRFDMIFIVKDERSHHKDTLIAHHILSLHAKDYDQEAEGEIPTDLLREYVSFCKENCSPRLSAEAATLLENYYVDIREEMRSDKRKNRDKIPITVRQLEAISRIAESFAKMELSNVVIEKHIEGAMRLFTSATMDAARSTLQFDSLTPAEQQYVMEAEEAIKHRLPVKARSSKTTIVRDLVSHGYDASYIGRAIRILIQRGDLIERADHSVFRAK